jgi:hypothetical protein
MNEENTLAPGLGEADQQGAPLDGVAVWLGRSDLVGKKRCVCVSVGHVCPTERDDCAKDQVMVAAACGFCQARYGVVRFLIYSSGIKLLCCSMKLRH